MASRLQGKRVLIAGYEAVMGSSISGATRAEGAGLVADHRDLTTHKTERIDALIARIAFRFRRWRKDQQTWAALRHLDDRQLNEFGIYLRPPDLTKRKFP